MQYVFSTRNMKLACTSLLVLLVVLEAFVLPPAVAQAPCATIEYINSGAISDVIPTTVVAYDGTSHIVSTTLNGVLTRTAKKIIFGGPLYTRDVHLSCNFRPRGLLRSVTSEVTLLFTPGGIPFGSPSCWQPIGQGLIPTQLISNPSMAYMPYSGIGSDTSPVTGSYDGSVVFASHQIALNASYGITRIKYNFAGGQWSQDLVKPGFTATVMTTNWDGSIVAYWRPSGGTAVRIIDGVTLADKAIVTARCTCGAPAQVANGIAMNRDGTILAFGYAPATASQSCTSCTQAPIGHIQLWTTADGGTTWNYHSNVTYGDATDTAWFGHSLDLSGDGLTLTTVSLVSVSGAVQSLSPRAYIFVRKTTAESFRLWNTYSLAGQVVNTGDPTVIPKTKVSFDGRIAVFMVYSYRITAAVNIWTSSLTFVDTTTNITSILYTPTTGTSSSAFEGIMSLRLVPDGSVLYVNTRREGGNIITYMRDPSWHYAYNTTVSSNYPINAIHSTYTGSNVFTLGNEAFVRVLG